MNFNVTTIFSVPELKKMRSAFKEQKKHDVLMNKVVQQATKSYQVSIQRVRRPLKSAAALKNPPSSPSCCSESEDPVACTS